MSRLGHSRPRSLFHKLPLEVRLPVYELLYTNSRPCPSDLLEIGPLLNLFESFPDLWHDLGALRSALHKKIDISAFHYPHESTCKRNLPHPPPRAIFEGAEDKIFIRQAFWQPQQCCDSTYRTLSYLRSSFDIQDFEVLVCYGCLDSQLRHLLDQLKADFQSQGRRLLLIPQSPAAARSCGCPNAPSFQLAPSWRGCVPLSLRSIPLSQPVNTFSTCKGADEFTEMWLQRCTVDQSRSIQERAAR